MKDTKEERARPNPMVAPLTSSPRTIPSVRKRPLSMPGLVAIIYCSVAGGPFGTEDVVSAAGPLLGLLGFIIMPLVWSAPEALVAAELATAFPSNGGYVTWVTAAFGPFWGFLEGWLSWLCNVSDSAIYPVLFCDYLKHVWYGAGQGETRMACILIFTVAMSWLNYRGLDIMAWSAMGFVLLTIAPFLYIVPVGLPEVELSNVLIVPKLEEIQWQKYMNVLFWNLNYWDSAATLAGEVHNARKVFPQALMLTAVLVMASYILPLFVGVGIGGRDGGTGWRNWHSGSLTLVGEKTGGFIVKTWVVWASAISNIGQFACEQASTAYQLQGMSEWGWLPKGLNKRSRYGTPHVCLLLGLCVTLPLSGCDFLSLVKLLNGLYCEAQLLEFAAFLYLRVRHPNLRRPFRVPLDSTGGCVCMLLAPMLFATLLLALPALNGQWLQFGCLVIVPVLGALVYKLLSVCRRNGWLQFTREPPGSVEEVLSLQTPVSTCVRPLIGEALVEPLLLPPAALSGDTERL